MVILLLANYQICINHEKLDQRCRKCLTAQIDDPANLEKSKENTIGNRSFPGAGLKKTAPEAYSAQIFVKEKEKTKENR
jgi:hypothetical protein